MTKARDLASAAPAPSTVSSEELGYVDGVTSAIQTQLDAKIAKTLTSTTGDIIYASGANTPARLGIGSTGNVLTVASGVPSWAAPAAGGGYALLNAGGTSLSGTTTTISSLSGYNKLMVLITTASSDSASSSMGIRFNADSGSNYFYMQGYATSLSTYAGGIVDNTANTTGTSIPIGQMSDSIASVISGHLYVDGANSSGIKVCQYATGATPRPGGFTNRFIAGGGNYSGSSVISSISFISSAGSWDSGTVYVYGAN